MIKGNCQFSNHKLPPIRGMTTAEIWKGFDKKLLNRLTLHKQIKRDR